MNELVQIQDASVPPWRQSLESVTACPTFYVESVIKGRKRPSGMESARGTQVHHAMSQYASWCAAKGVGVDLDAFEEFSRGAGREASKILSGIRDGYTVDHQHLLSTEVMMSLDEEFRPTDLSEAIAGIVRDSGMPAAYQGTLDTLYIFREENKILCDDFKTHMRPYDPSDAKYAMQGQMYALFLMQYFAWAEEVTFRLLFVRYRNIVKSVTYHRSDLPMLIDVVKSARARQKMIHADYEAGRDIQAIPGDQCCYCPLLSNMQCPVAEFNEQMQLTPEEWVKFSLWYQAFNRVNNARMKDRVQSTGRPITLKDYNGKIYRYGPVEKESHIYPLFKASPAGGLLRDHHGTPILPIIDLLLEHVNQNPDDVEWLTKLSISATKLESALKTKKRVVTHQAVTDTADQITKVTLKVSKPLDVEDLEPEEFDEDREEKDDDF